MTAQAMCYWYETVSESGSRRRRELTRVGCLCCVERNALRFYVRLPLRPTRDPGERVPHALA